MKYELSFSRIPEPDTGHDSKADESNPGISSMFI